MNGTGILGEKNGIVHQYSVKLNRVEYATVRMTKANDVFWSKVRLRSRETPWHVDMKHLDVPVLPCEVRDPWEWVTEQHVTTGSNYACVIRQGGFCSTCKTVILSKISGLENWIQPFQPVFCVILWISCYVKFFQRKEVRFKPLYTNNFVSMSKPLWTLLTLAFPVSFDGKKGKL